MKKLFVLVLLVMVSTVTFPQMTWNVQAGINMSSITDSEADMKVGFQAGVGMDYALTDMWSIRPSLLLIMKGAKAEAGGIEVKSNPMYLQLPVMAAANFDLSDNMKFVAKAGPYLGVGVGGKVKVEEGGIEVKKDFFGDDADQAGGKRFEFGLGIGGGLEFGQIMVNLDALFGLTKIMKYDSSKNLTVALSVGYKF